MGRYFLKSGANWENLIFGLFASTYVFKCSDPLEGWRSALW